MMFERLCSPRAPAPGEQSCCTPVFQLQLLSSHALRWTNCSATPQAQPLTLWCCLAFKWVQALPHLLCMVVTVVGLSPPLILSISAACRQVKSESESVKPEMVQRLDRLHKVQRSHISQGIPDDTCAGSLLPAVSHICERPQLLAESCRSVSGAESAPSGSDWSLAS